LLKEDGSLDAKRLKNIAVIAQYGFTYP